MKFKLTKETKVYFDKTLFQIEALKDFGNVKKGDKGGWVEKEKNLSQKGNAWISGNAEISGDAWIYGDAIISEDAWIYGNAWISGNAVIYGDARIYGNARISGNARIYGDIIISEDATISGNAMISGDAIISEDATISGNAIISGDARISGKLKISSGFFFGIRSQKEKIKYIKVDEDYDLIYKGDAKFGEEDEEDDTVEIIVEGKTKKISRMSAKELNLI